MIKTPIAYPGAKGKVCDLLIQCVPQGIEDWREPFFGGGSVTIAFLQSTQGRNCKKFIVGDLYKEVYYFWKAVQEYPVEMSAALYEHFNEKLRMKLEELHKLPTNSKEYQDLYKFLHDVTIKEVWDWTTEADVESLSIPHRGARFLLRSKMSFSGTADSGGMSMANATSIDLERICTNIRNVSALLEPVEIYNQSFEDTMANVDDEKSFIFLDPPYITQEIGSLYGRGGDTHTGFPHQRLADLCMKTKARWLMTLDDCTKARRLYSGAIFNPLHITYTMSGITNRDNRLNGEELLISNYGLDDKCTRAEAFKLNNGAEEKAKAEADDLAARFGF